MNIKTIADILKQHSQSLKRDFQVSRFGIFGSVARGNAKKTSDIDILVEFSRPIGLFKFIALEEQLKLLLHKDVDLVTKNALKPAIKQEILNQAIYV